MRVTNNMMLRNTTSNINNNKYSVNSLNNQMSSQKKISRPSEKGIQQTGSKSFRIGCTSCQCKIRKHGFRRYGEFH